MSMSLSLYATARKSRPATPRAAECDRGLRVIQVPRRFVREEWGGTETTILQTSRALNARGNRSTICTTTALCDRKREEIDGVAVQRHDYLYPFWGLSAQDKRDMDRKGGNLMSFSLLASLLAGERPDILHAHTGKRLGGIVRTVSRLRGVPYVISLHGGVIDVPNEEMQQMLAPLRGTFEWGRALGALLGARRVLEDAAAIICVGQNEQRAVQARYPGQRVEWLPNGVDAQRFELGDGPAFRQRRGIPAERRVILCIGRIDAQKNQTALLPALAHLLGQGRDVQLVLVGPVTVESYREDLGRQVKRLKLEDRVTVLPGVPGGSAELVDAYHAADVFCLPSRHEPFGIVILEAWAAGLPVVAAPVGGIPTFTHDGEDILHASPEEPEALARALGRLLDEPELASRLATAGRTKARNEYDWSRISARLENLYDEVIRTCQ